MCIQHPLSLTWWKRLARPKILSELHFWRAQDQEQPDKWRITSQVRGEGRPIDNRLAMGGHIGGKEDFIQGEWSRAVEYAKSFDGMEVDNSDPMSPKTHDCRAGVKTVVEYLGLDFYHVKEVPGTASGSDASLEELIPGN